MATISKGEVVQKIIKGLRLDAAIDPIPNKSADFVQPVFNSNDAGVFRVLKEHSLNDSDKSFIVPSGFFWEIDSIHIDFTATATSGSRQIAIEISDEDGDVVYRIISNLANTASIQTDYIFQSNLNVFSVLSTIATGPLLKTVSPGWTIRVLDALAVDAAADDMLVSIHYKEFSEDQ